MSIMIFVVVIVFILTLAGRVNLFNCNYDTVLIIRYSKIKIKIYDAYKSNTIVLLKQ